MTRRPISVAFSAVLALSACGGGKASTNDCAVAVEKANAVSKTEIAKMNLSPQTEGQLKAITLKHCSEDKWDAKVVACLGSAKNNEETLKCTDGLAAEQKMKWQNDMAAALPKPTGEPTTPTTPPAGSGGSAEGSGSAGSGSGSSAAVDVPAECQDYKALMGRLATCEKLGAARATYQDVYTKNAATWAAVATPEAKAELAKSCKVAVEMIRKSAAATCGW